MRKGLVARGPDRGRGVTAVLYSKSNSSKDQRLQDRRGGARGPWSRRPWRSAPSRPKHEIAVKSKISGIVEDVLPRGRRPRPGPATLSSRSCPIRRPLELTEARREVEIAQNVFDQAKKKSDRARTRSRTRASSPPRTGSSAEKDIQDAQIRLELCHARSWPSSRRAGSRAEPGLTVESIIRAPIAGTVLELLVNEGDPVVPLTSYQAGTALTNLADMNDARLQGHGRRDRRGQAPRGHARAHQDRRAARREGRGQALQDLAQVEDRRRARRSSTSRSSSCPRRAWSCAPATRRTPTSWSGRRTTCSWCPSGS